LKDGIKIKNKLRKEKKTRVNLTNSQNLQHGLWDLGNSVESKLKNNYESHSINPMLNDKMRMNN